MWENEQRNKRSQKREICEKMSKEIKDQRREKYVGELPQKGIAGKKVAPAGICTYLHTITMTKVKMTMMMMIMMTMMMLMMITMMANQELHSSPCGQCKHRRHYKAGC